MKTKDGKASQLKVGMKLLMSGFEGEFETEVLDISDHPDDYVVVKLSVGGSVKFDKTADVKVIESP